MTIAETMPRTSEVEDKTTRIHSFSCSIIPCFSYHWLNWHRSQLMQGTENSGTKQSRGRARSGFGVNRPHAHSSSLPFASSVHQGDSLSYSCLTLMAPHQVPFAKLTYSSCCGLPCDPDLVIPLANLHGWTQVTPLSRNVLDHSRTPQ